ncbi:Predicted inosine-uridine preferring nucleoside hydrolase [Ceraceosorus bombacis]|uniref:Predicted inosine-uridine preferring nucleoside hydrolase n=1 Tax=Ceraceosorus bombacis TaxID=401625 RepID=A0A0P1BEC1_9BASI|nr:Predicted inosine-uridine preferring nucleoside hydrolase [Ceraceosorus bombacis]
MVKSIWLDADPGHDDAVALLLALYGRSSCTHTSPDVHLLGLSTVAGNACGLATWQNAAKLLVAYGADADAQRRGDIALIRGADEPLVQSVRADAAIHGEDGLGGVVGLPALSDARVQQYLHCPSRNANGLHTFISHLIALLQERTSNGLAPITIAATGPLTNLGANDQDKDGCLCSALLCSALCHPKPKKPAIPRDLDRDFCLLAVDSIQLRFGGQSSTSSWIPRQPA